MLLIISWNLEDAFVSWIFIVLLGKCIGVTGPTYTIIFVYGRTHIILNLEFYFVLRGEKEL